MGRRRVSAEVKMAAVPEGSRGETGIADICRRYGIAESLYYRWRDRFLEGGRQALEQSSGTSKADKLKNEIKELQRITGKQTVDHVSTNSIKKCLDFRGALRLCG